MADKISIEDMAAFCKKKGFVYPNSEIYGGLAGFWDFGHLGSELKKNLKESWWKFHVQDREDIVGIDGSIITHPKVWEASGHVDSFTDLLVDCRKCGMRYRADMLIEDVLKVKTEGMKKQGIMDLLKKIKCPKCRSELGEPKPFNLMFQTNVGPVAGSTAYLRPETAQVIFADFKLVADNARLKLPFGIAQIGKAYRNEISPRDFLFRCREFEQMEIEYFAHPGKVNECPYLKEVLDYRINVLSAESQVKKKEHVKMSMKEALDKEIIKTAWHAYWLAMEHKWFVGLGADADKFRIRQHTPGELSHYALDTWDMEYEFPFGWKELQGMANRTDFDLKQHIKVSGKDLSLFDQDSGKKVIPHVVAEPSQGVERAVLVFLFDAYNYDKERGNVVLKLHPKLAPVKVGVFPLVNKLNKDARKVFDMLRKEFVCQWDASGSIGRRYARADEIGIYAAVTVDFDSLKDDSVTLRSRDTTKQVRVKISELKDKIRRFLNGEELEKLGKIVK
jgi:glycyl-tRNA synthetase